MNVEHLTDEFTRIDAIWNGAVNRLVPGTLALQNAIVLLRSSLYQHGNRGVECMLVILERGTLDMLDQTVETLLDNGPRRGIYDLRGGGTLAFGVDEGEGLRKPGLIHERYRLLEIFISLTGESDDDIGCKRDMGNAIAHAMHEVEILLTRVLPIHELEYARGTGLHGKVQLRHDGGNLRHRIDGLGQQILGMR